jgi:hypothetical protein
MFFVRVDSEQVGMEESRVQEAQQLRDEAQHKKGEIA